MLHSPCNGGGGGGGLAAPPVAIEVGSSFALPFPSRLECRSLRSLRSKRGETDGRTDGRRERGREGSGRRPTVA